MEIIIISVLHFLSETTGADFTDRKRTMRTLILEAMLTPEGELPDLYATARREGKPPRHYQNAMVAVKCNVWHGHGIKTFGPLAPNPVLTWTALKNAVVDLICRQVVPQMTFTKCLEDFKNGKWAQRRNQTVSEFEGEFLNKESILRAACEHDGKDQNRHIPCQDDMQKLFISKISSAVKVEAHAMLTERRADYMMETNLTYANGRFEELHPHDFLQLMTITEDIMLKREASKEANLGESAASPPYKYQGRDRGPHLPQATRSQWQRKELAKEIKSNATVANAGDISDLQVVVGDYTNSTKFFTQKNKCWCAPVREYAQSTVQQLWASALHRHPMQGRRQLREDASERQALCVSIKHDQGHGGWHFQALDSSVPGWHWGTSQGQDWTRGSCSSCADHSGARLDEERGQRMQSRRKAKAASEGQEEPRRRLKNQTATEEAEEEAGTSRRIQRLQSRTFPLRPDPRSSRSRGQRGRSQLATREERRGTTSVLTIRARPAQRTCLCVQRQPIAGWEHRHGHRCTGTASNSGSSEGSNGAKANSPSATVQRDR